jgi:hypothetical protein
MFSEAIFRNIPVSEMTEMFTLWNHCGSWRRRLGTAESNEDTASRDGSNKENTRDMSQYTSTYAHNTVVRKLVFDPFSDLNNGSKTSSTNQFEDCHDQISALRSLCTWVTCIFQVSCAPIMHHGSSHDHDHISGVKRQLRVQPQSDFHVSPILIHTTSSSVVPECRYDNFKPSEAVFKLNNAELKEHLALDASPLPTYRHKYPTKYLAYYRVHPCQRLYSR